MPHEFELINVGYIQVYLEKKVTIHPTPSHHHKIDLY